MTLKDKRLYTENLSETIELIDLLKTKSYNFVIFRKHLVLINSHLTGMDLSKRLKSEVSVEFINCIFEKGFSFNFNLNFSFNIQNIFKINFKDCIIKSLIGDSRFPSTKLANFDSKSLKFELDFIHCVIDSIEIEQSNLNSLTFIQCVFFPYSLNIRESDIKIIYLSNCIGTHFIVDCFSSNVHIDMHDHNIKLERKSIDPVIKQICMQNDIKSIYFLKTLFSIQNCVSSSITFDKSKKSGYSKEIIPSNTETSFETKYYLKETDLSKLNISLHVKLTSIDDAVLKIDKAILNVLHISGKNQTKIKVNNLRVNSISIEDYECKSGDFFNIRSVGSESKFQIKDSDLSNIWFNKLNLKSFSMINMYRSTLEEVRFSATKFPSEIICVENIYEPLKINEDYYDDVYENYRQLKYTLLKSGDFVGALLMHQKMYNAIHKSTHLGRQDRIILFVNRISNNHATSIYRAFLLSISLILFFHLLNMVAMKDAPYQCGWDGFHSFFSASYDTMKYTFKNYKQVFVIANPVHRLSDFSLIGSLGNFSEGNYAVSFFSRIGIAWAYYQFVMAFRKFGKV